MKCSYAAFGEQNKTDNDSKCQLVYKSLFLSILVVLNVPVNEVDRVKEIVVSEMQNVVHLTVPLIADCGVGKNWLEAH